MGELEKKPKIGGIIMLMDEYNILRKKTNKKKGFAATPLLASLAMILLLVGLFVFLAGKYDKDTNVAVNSSDASYLSAEASNEKTSPVGKARIFNENLRTIKDAAVSYFTNERLPRNIGDTVKLTLSEMQNKKLVLDIVDSYEKSCSSTKSYVEVTKEKNEYLMKIFLSCSDDEDYIIIHLGCYDYCKDHICEKEVTPGITEFEYEYKKTIACKMTDWSAWSEWKKEKEATSNLKKEETKVEKETKSFTEVIDATLLPATYSCETYGNDYKLDDKKCIKTIVTKDIIDAIKGEYSYNCDAYPGYTLNGKVCEKEVTSTDIIDATKGEDVYTCDDGYTLVGNKCEKEVKKVDIKPATISQETYTCPSEYTLDGDKCYKLVKTTDVKEATLTCKSGYALEKGQCVKTYNDIDTVPGTTTKSYYICPDGYSKKETECTREVEKTENADLVLTCTGVYKLVSGKCLSTYKEAEYIDATPVYSTKTVEYTHDCYKPECTTKLVMDCSSGSCQMVQKESCEDKKTTCTDTKQENYISGYTCPNKYEKQGNSCMIEVEKTSTKLPVSTCPEGFTKNGNTCTRTYKDVETIKATYVPATHTCPSGYNDNGSNCTKSVQKKDVITPDKTCLSGYTLNTNNKCEKEENTKEFKDVIVGPKGYTCESGYVLNTNNECERTFSDKEIVDAKKDPDKYSCKEGYTLKGNKCEKTNVTIDKVDATKVEGGYTCKDGYTLNSENKCEKEITTTDIKDAMENEVSYSCPEGYNKEGSKCTRVITEEIEVTYYRYATRSCVGGSTDIKWSSSNDKTLLDSGYKLTGNKRAITIEK